MVLKAESGLFNLELDTTVILCDNQSCIKMIENPVFHDRSKHIEIRYFYIWDMMQKEAIKLQYVSIDEQVADVLTKPLSWVTFEYFWDKLGVVRKDLPRKGEQWCCNGIVSSLDTCPKSDPVTSVLKNEEGLYHPRKSI